MNDDRPRRKPPRRRLAVLLPLAALLLAGLAGFALADNAYNRGVAYTPGPVPVAWADVPQLGVNAYNLQFEPDRANVTRTLELARDLGAHFVRMQLPWEDVEIHAKGDFEDRRDPQAAHNAWDKYDFIFGELRRLGLEPIVRIDRPPDWARARALATPEFQARRAANGNATGPPDRYADYADFVGAVAARYRDRVRFIQIWNEPNLVDEWNGQHPAPAQFVDLLRQAAASARAANPDAVILFPSLSPTDGLDKLAPLSDLEYLDQVYALGGRPAFDIMSAQAYGLGQPPEEHRYIYARRYANWSWRQPIDTRIDVSRVVLVREVMEHHGDAGKAIWISEFGYVTDSPSIPPDKRTTWGAPVTEQQKGEYLVGQLERARREWPWVGAMNIWFLRWGGEAPNPADPTANFAIVGRDFRPLPAYQAIKAYVARGPVAGAGAHAWDHPAVAPAGAPNSWSLRFAGSALTLVGMRGPTQVALDGGPARLVNPDVEGGPVTVLSGAGDGPHTVELSAQNGPPRAFVVERARPLAWLWLAAPALLLAGLAVTGALILRALAK